MSIYKVIFVLRKGTIIMQKTLKKIISIVLALTMLFALTATAASAIGTKKQYTEYTVIGDSIATGLCLIGDDGLPHRGASNGKITKGAYPLRICEAYGIDTAQAKLGETTKENEKLHVYAREGLSSIEARMLLDPTYVPDAEDSWITDMGKYLYFEGEDGFKALQNSIVDDIKNSDLITVEIGNNDLFMYASSRVQFELYGFRNSTMGAKQREALVKMDEQVKAMFAEGASQVEIWNTIYNTMLSINKVEILLEAFATALIRGYMNMAKNWPVVMKKIHQINPNATVVALGMFNAGNGLKIMEQLPFDLSPAVFPVVELMNSVMMKYQAIYGYKFVSTMGTPLRAWTPLLQWTQETYMVELLYGAHPPLEGHEYITKKILAAI